MTLDTGKFTLPDGAPADAKQPMKSATWGEDGSGNLTNGTVFIDADMGDRILVISGDITLTNAGRPTNIYKIDCTSGPVTVTIPLSTTVHGQDYTFVKVDTTNNIATIAAGGGEDINGEPTDRLVTQHDTLDIFANGGNYFIRGQNNANKVLSVNLSADQTGIPPNTPTLVEFDNVNAESPNGSYDNVTNFDWSPGNGIYSLIVSVELGLLDNSDFFEVSIRKNGNIVASDRKYASANDQDTTVRVSEFTNNTDPSFLSGPFDVYIEHSHISNLDILANSATTFFKAVRLG